MLGLGSGITHSSFDPLELLGEYNSNFAAGTDSWGDFGIAAGTQTKTANQSIGGRSGVLKVSYNADETVQFGLELATPWSKDFKVGDQVYVSLDVYQVDEAPTDGSSGPNFFFQAGDSFHASRRPLSQLVGEGGWVTKSGTAIITAGTDDGNMRIGFNAQGNAPGTGDHWYLDNVVVKHYRPK